VGEGRPSKQRLNIGCGEFPLFYWINLDESERVRADIHCHVPPVPFEDASLDEIYLGHVLEHNEPAEALALLRDCRRALKPGGTLGAMVPDAREVFRRYVNGEAAPMRLGFGHEYDLRDLDRVCETVIYSTVQDSRHRWCYDLDTLARLLKLAGFTPHREINRFVDPRVPMGAWYQCGWDCYPTPEEATP
jgi:SAM-dependent methyltransferase